MKKALLAVLVLALVLNMGACKGNGNASSTPESADTATTTTTGSTVSSATESTTDSSAESSITSGSTDKKASSRSTTAANKVRKTTQSTTKTTTNPTSPPDLEKVPLKNRYFFSESGDDKNDGHTPATPLTIEALYDITPKPGDHFLFKRGETFELDASFTDWTGTKEAPIVFEPYGEGKAPEFYSSSSKIIYFQDASHLKMDGLKFVTLNENIYYQGGRSYCIQFVYSGGVACEDIVITNCEFAGVSPDTMTFGLVFLSNAPADVSGISAPYCKNITVHNNKFHDLGAYTVHFGGYDTTNKKDHIFQGFYGNVDIISNEVYNCGTQGIILGCTTGGRILRNYVHDNGGFKGFNDYGPSAMWVVASKNVDIMFNECCYQQDGNSGADGTGIDIDWSVEHCNVQYNYVHHNMGSGIETMSCYTSTIANNRVEYNKAELLPGSGQITLSQTTGDPNFLGVQNMQIKDNLILLKSNTCALFTTWGSPNRWFDNSFTNNRVVVKKDIRNYQMYLMNQGGIVETIDRNRFYGVKDGYFYCEYINGGIYDVLSVWNKLGFDKNTTFEGLDEKAPSVPQNLKVTAGKGNNALSWSASTDSESGVWHYNIYRSEKKNFVPSYLNMIGEAEGLTFTDDVEFETGKQYYYFVEAEDNCGNRSKHP